MPVAQDWKERLLVALERGNESLVREQLRRLTPDIVAEWMVELPLEYRSRILDLLWPGDAADALERLTPQQAAEVLIRLDDEEAADILELMDDEPASRVIEQLAPERAADLLEEMASDEAADLLAEMVPERSETLLREMEPEEREEVLSLLEYPPDTAGGRMITEVLALNVRFTVEEAIRFIRQHSDRLEALYYLYVVDDERHLLGVVSLRDLLISPPSTPLQAILNPDVVTVHAQEDQENVAQLFRRHRYLALPVVDDEQHLLGVVTVDDVLEVMEEEATEDALQMVGVTGLERVFSPVRDSVRRRLPWLFVNLGTAFLAAWVVSLFETTISRATALAVLMPIVAGQGGNAGTQTLTIIIRGMAMGEISLRNGLQALWKEIRVGLLTGVSIGLAVGWAAFLWQGNPYLGLVIGLAMVLNLLAAAMAGVLIPLGLRWVGIDPALASAIFLTTVTDCAGFFFFLGLGTLFLPHLR